MNFIFTVISVALFVSTQAAVMNEIPVAGRVSQAEIERLKEKIAAAGGCNANVCFAIDGSGSISEKAFESQKNFVLDVVSVIVDNPVELAAYQYATSVTTISRLTPDDSGFILAVDEEVQLKGSSFVVGGINACFSELFRRRGEALKIVLLGDGKSNIGSDAVSRADLFRQIGGQVCTVGAGFTDDEQLLDIAGGDPNKVFRVDSFLDVLGLEAILEGLVLGICQIKP